MNAKKLLTCVGAWALAASASAQSTPADSARVLAGNCANCHGTTGNAKGAMPSLAGRDRKYIIEQMQAFRDGKRPATIMHQLAKGYTDQQVELIADFFARQKPAS
ncbi:MAG: c-type cytochrome [Burkholderiaceae bacterium]